MNQDYTGMIAEARNRFGPAPRRIGFRMRRQLKLKPPTWCKTADDPLLRNYADHEFLWHEGQIVWGQLVQVNTMMFQPKCPANAPGDVIFSFEQFWGDELQPLKMIADKIDDDKQAFLDTFDDDDDDEDYDDVEERRQAEEFHRSAELMLRVETDSDYFTELFAGGRARMLGTRIPNRYCTESPCYLNSLIYHRELFPVDYLACTHFPLLVHPKCAGVMILPSRWWPKSLITEWKRSAGRF